MGKKVVEATASDVLAMGGVPRNLLVSLSSSKDREVDEIEELYWGMKDACTRLDARINSGDLTSSPGKMMLSLVCFGELVEECGPATRSGVSPGNKLAVSGPLGSSHAGLQAFLHKLSG